MSRLFSLILTLTLFSSSPSTQVRSTIQDQGSSPFCLFSTAAYITNQDMWMLSVEYNRRNYPVYNNATPHTDYLIRMISEKYPISYIRQWDTDQTQSTVQIKPVVVTGMGHAIVLVSWKDGKIKYVDSLHSGNELSMTNHEFWKWWNGWGWYVK